MTDKKWAYEDLEVNRILDIGTKTVTAEEIVGFAREFDPQPMHLDEAAGKAGILDGLSASGWHTCSIYMRMICDAYLLDSTCQGAPGVDHMRWKRPVLAGDTLTGASTVTAKRLSQSRPKLGFVTFRYELANQNGETVLEMQNTAMFLRRNPS